MNKKNSILIVDDDTSNLLELSSILQPDYKIYAVKNGTSALEKADESLPDLILLDVIMPDMNGFDVLIELKRSEKTKNIPVIFITGLNESEREGLAIGAVDYIRKPFDSMVVKHRVRLQIHIINLQRDLENAAKAAEESAEVAKAANESKSSFLANMSHEIRTPMNAIMGITDILLLHESLPDEVTEGLDKIYASSDMLLGIINDILDFSKIEAGKLDIIPAEYRVASLINDSLNLNMMKIGDKPIEFELRIDENVPAKLIGDELRIKQILNNILSNAFKYTNAGKVTLSVFVEKKPEKDEVIIMFDIKDTGQGMTEAQLGVLFEEYSRFNEGANRTIEGTGLGLSITLRLINLMNGTIHVESEPGIGSLFTVHLPQGIVDAEVLGKEVTENLKQFLQSDIEHKKSHKIVREPMPYGRILIVDDVETNLFVAVRLLKPYKLRVETAANGREAIEKIKVGNEYDIIFMDHMMPEMDGIEATKHIRDFGYINSIIALTANAVAGQSDIFLNNGFDAFISKPIDIRQLDSILKKYIREKQPQEVIEAARLQKNGVDANGSVDIQSNVDSLMQESFIRDAKKAVAVLDELNKSTLWFENEESLRRYIITIHGIKSGLWNIGETELSDLADKLEIGGRERNFGLIELSASDFLKGLRVLLVKFEHEYDTDSTMDDMDEDIESLRDKLITIGKMCADYNRKGALDILANIKKCSKQTKVVVDCIKEHIHHADFGEAELAAAGYAAIIAAQSRTLINKEITGLDIIKGLEKYEGDEKVYIKILRSYTSGIRTLLSAIKVVDEDNLIDFKLKIHSIKGTSLDIYANEIGNTAADLENAAIAGDINFINENTPAFLETAWKTVNELEVMLLDISDKNPKPKKDKPETELLSQLLAACEVYNMDGVDKAMAEIEKYQYESDNGLADWLCEKADKMDFVQIVEKLSNGWDT